jgi:cobalamin biosynthesis Co2+ chelatase CbiK
MQTQLQLMLNELIAITSEETMIEVMAAINQVVTTRQTKALDIVVKKLKNHKITEVILADKKQYQTLVSMLQLCGKTWNDGMPMDSLDPWQEIESNEYLVLCIYKNGVGYYGAKERNDQLTILEYAKL